MLKTILKPLQSLLTVSLAIVVTGCLSQPLVKPQTKLIVTPEALDQECRIYPPTENSEKGISEGYIRTMFEVKKCNDLRKRRLEWVGKQKQIYKETPM